MLKHIVLMELQSDAPAGAADAILTALRALPAAIPEIRSLEAGPNVVESDRNLDLGLVVDFDDRAALDHYAAHPAHVAVVQDHIKPVLVRSVVVDFEY